MCQTEQGRTGMTSAAEQRGKEEWLLFNYIHLRASQAKDFSTKKHGLQGRPENTEMNRQL